MRQRLEDVGQMPIVLEKLKKQLDVVMTAKRGLENERDLLLNEIESLVCKQICSIRC